MIPRSYRWTLAGLSNSELIFIEWTIARQRLWQRQNRELYWKINEIKQSSSKSMSIADPPARRVSVNARVIEFRPSSSFGAFFERRRRRAKEEWKHTSERELCFYVPCQKRFMINLSTDCRSIDKKLAFRCESFWQLFTEPKGEKYVCYCWAGSRWVGGGDVKNLSASQKDFDVLCATVTVPMPWQQISESSILLCNV